MADAVSYEFDLLESERRHQSETETFSYVFPVGFWRSSRFLGCFGQNRAPLTEKCLAAT